MKKLLFVLVLAMLAGPAWAGLCADCEGRMLTRDLGKCTNCGARTLSGMFKLCPDCGSKLGKCMICLAAVPAAKPAADGPATQPASDAAEQELADEKIDATRAGTYTQGKWKYELKVVERGPAMIRTGTLSYDGKPVPSGKGMNDYYETPWGRLFWIGKGQGFVPMGVSPYSVAGKALPHPSRTLAATTQPATASQPTTQPSAPTAQAKAIADAMRKNIGQWQLSLIEVLNQNALDQTLVLHTATLNFFRQPDETCVKIDDAAAGKIIAYLLDSGLLNRAELTKNHLKAQSGAKRLVIGLQAGGKAYAIDLPWTKSSQQHLLAMTKLLPANAADQWHKVADGLLQDKTALNDKLSAKAAKRAALLKDDLADFEFFLNYAGPEEKPFYRLRLTTMVIPKGDDFSRAVSISKDHAANLIDYLAEEGFLDHAEELTKERQAKLVDGYTVTVRGGKLALIEGWGFDAAMYDRLAKLAPNIPKEANGDMDLLMQRLSGLKRQWDAQKTPPQEQPAIRRK